jgi:hypothetical protein
MNKIDVLFPVGNEHRFLESAIKSVRDSKGVLPRIIFIDNGIKELNLGRYANKNDIVLRAPTRGYTQALNFAHRADIDWGPYVAHMNSDDLIHQMRLKTQLDGLKEYLADLSICKLQKIDANSRRKHSFYGDPNYDYWHPLILMFGSYGADASWVSTSDWWVKNGLRNDRIHPDLADLELALRVFPQTKIKVENSPLYYYRMHRLQMSRSGYKPSDLYMMNDIFAEFLGTYGIEPVSSSSLLNLRPRGRSPAAFLVNGESDLSGINLDADVIIKKIAEAFDNTESVLSSYRKIIDNRILSITFRGKMKLMYFYLIDRGI